jgi:N-methylhydantoinase A
VSRRAGTLRFAVDTGGTFTDLVIEGETQALRFYKRPTTPDDPVVGLLDVLGAAAADFGVTRRELLARGEIFIFGTTRATNAVVTGTVAKTALLTTQGHPDILLLREGGERTTLFDYTQQYPDPYIPRSLTFEVVERCLASGAVHVPLDEVSVLEIIRQLAERAVEAVAVSFLWSIANPAHELRVGELLEQHLPGVPYTLSHRLNPSLREYRRTSSAAIDASLKPLMSRFFAHLDEQLCAEGFEGRLLIMTSAGGVLDAREVAQTPIHSIGSGPAAAPVAGRFFAELDAASDMAIVTDAGGTTYDVSLIRRGQIPWTRETMVGDSAYGHKTGFPSVDVRSIGAGGGSIAWVDEGGLLHVGPKSAGAVPGPASYGRGGTEPTVTDACVVLGYIDPEYFLGGEMKLDSERAAEALERVVAGPLGLELHEAASAVLDLAVERMVRAIEEITLNQGIDPTQAVVVGGGGGAGLYSVGIARRLGSATIVIPEVAAALSATGALLSDLRADYALTEVTSTADFDFDRVARVLQKLQGLCREFSEGPGKGAIRSNVHLSVEGRYPHQVWEIEVPLRVEGFESVEQVEALRQDFHDVHEELFAIRDVESPVELVTWRARVSCTLREVDLASRAVFDSGSKPRQRHAHFAGHGLIETAVRDLESLDLGGRHEGPLIVESPTTTIVVDPEAALERLPSGSLRLLPWKSHDPARDSLAATDSRPE